MAGPTAASLDVAALIPERVGSTGADFTAGTTPTQAQVLDLIAKTVEEVVAVVGPTIDSSLTAYATLVVATGSAARVELSFTNDVAGDPESKYRELWEQYWGKRADGKPAGMLALLADAQNKIADGGIPGISDPATPYAQFPLTSSTDPIGGVRVSTLTEHF